MARSHKYIRRTGAPKQYHYIYQEPVHGIAGDIPREELDRKLDKDRLMRVARRKQTFKTFKMEAEEASKVLRDLETQGKKGTEEWKNAVEDWKDALDQPQAKTMKMERPFDVPVLPMSRRAKKFYIENIDRKLGIKPSVSKLEAEMESKWQKVPKELQYNPWETPPKGTEEYNKLKDWKDAKVRYERAKEGADFKEGKTFKMEGEAPRHIVLEGGPNRRLKPEEKAKFFKDQLEHSEPTHLKPQVKTNINNSLYSVTGYHDAIPLDKIFDVLKAHGIVPLQEDNTEWSGLLMGREGQVYLPIAPFGSRSPEKEFEHTYKPFKNAKLSVSWYTMPSGRYEIGAHVG